MGKVSDVKMRRVKTAVALTAALIPSICALSACSSGETPSTSVKIVSNASPVDSPRAVDPAGKVLDIPAISDLASIGSRAAVRSGNQLMVGTVAELKAKKATTLDLDAHCGELGISTQGFTVPCGDKVYVIDPTSPTLKKSLPAHNATLAALMSDGTLITAHSDSNEVHVGESSFKAARSSTHLVGVPGDTVVRGSTFDSTIEDLQWKELKDGGILRAGQGLAQIAPGEHSLVLVTDVASNQLLVYSTKGIIVERQAGPVGKSPWGVAWDRLRQLAWVSTTADNKLTAYDISSGQPVQTAQINSVADVRHLTVLDDGVILAGSSHGDGLQIIDSRDIPNNA